MQPFIVPFASFIALLFNLLMVSTSAKCYYSNGSDITTYATTREATAYKPCNASAEASMCCRNGGLPGDHCRDDGLCWAADYSYIWRESCTDPTWKSLHCQKLCLNYDGLDPWGGSVKGNNVDVTQCDDGSFCCGVGTNGSTCCTEGRGVWMKNGKETKVNPSITFSATTSPSATSAAPAAQTSKPVAVSHHSNAGAIAGGGVGGVIALILLLGLLYWIMRRRHSGVVSKPGETHAVSDMGKEKGVLTELPSVDRPYEADSQPRIEMGGGTWQTQTHRSSPR